MPVVSPIFYLPIVVQSMPRVLRIPIIAGQSITTPPPTTGQLWPRGK